MSKTRTFTGRVANRLPSNIVQVIMMSSMGFIVAACIGVGITVFVARFLDIGDHLVTITTVTGLVGGGIMAYTELN